MSSIMEALKQFEATEANLLKLQRLWDELQKLFPAGISLDHNPEYDDRCRSLAGLLKALPMIDGWKPEINPPDPADVGSARFDYMELGEPFAEAQFEASLWSDGQLINEYRFRLDQMRRALIRDALLEVIDDFEKCLQGIEPGAEDLEGYIELGDRPEWAQLRSHANQIEVLLGSSVEKPAGWMNLRRHLSFGQVADLRDIRKNDWPAVKAGLHKGLYGANEPLPVAVTDLGDLVASKPRGPVATKLEWAKLDADGFERLIFTLISNQAGYENPEWLMRTSAPDRGRDLSVTRILTDGLSGTRRERVMIQCKHWLSKSVALAEASVAKEQTSIWTDPPVTVLIIATSGRFTADGVQWIERHNATGSVPRIEVWAESHLELLLAARPALIAEFGLR